MRLLLNDFAGYAFPGELARELARRGHAVAHTHCASLPTTPQGSLARQPGDPPGLEFRALALGAPLEKYRFVTRWRQEREYGRRVAAEVRSFRPDVVLSADTPLDAQAALYRASRGVDARVVFWLQDLLGVAAERILRHKVPVVGAAVGRHYVRLEARLLRQSDRVVAITDDFRPLLRRWGVPDDRVSTVENWAPIERLPVGEKGSAWAREAGLSEAFVFLYTGTLALKHNPDRLLDLALRLDGRDVDGRPARVVVLSQGPGADYLREQAAARRLASLDVRPYVPFAHVPDAMAAADVLVAVLEPDAGAFSVPSKVLAYLCAARPVLLAVPTENLAARIVAREGAGLVVPPDDGPGFLDAAEHLLADRGLRDAMGRAARTYAEATFPIGAIADRMERVLDDARSGAPAGP
jgi:colanic acid biosynthesis glycosyl transferase WcaI